MRPDPHGGSGAVKTTCPYCGVGCGIIATPRRDGSVEIAGDPDHPANFGRLCSKGSALGETLSLDDRLLFPEIGGTRASWDHALDHVAHKFSETVREHGPNSVAFYVSGQILTEDYYVANKLMKGFIGSANIDTNSRLCMASSVAGHKRAFGSDTVPGTYEDLELADLVVLAGSNLAWCHPVLFQRLAAAKEKRRTKIVVIDPRRTATCEIADLHLAIKPGSDVALFNGLLTQIDGASAIDREYAAKYTNGLTDALRAARELSTSQISRITGISQLDLFRFYDLFVETERVVTVYSQGVNQSIAGTDKVNAIINCHLATGRIGKPGMGPFSVTGQPNAMGGREVGGLANMLAAHMELGSAEHRRIVQDFWNSPRIASEPGLKAVDLFRAVESGEVKALWIMATNPVDSMPEADRVRAALATCPFVVVSDVVRMTDTTALGHVLLPSAAWGEKDGTVTNSERRISRQRAFLPLPGEARPDWWQLSEVARRMGFGEAFAWTTQAEIFSEHAKLSAEENAGTRDFDIGAYAGITAPDYSALAPFQWPMPADEFAGSRFFANGRFFTQDRRARCVPTPFRPPAAGPSEQYPLVLNTGRIRDQWHTMTRTAKSARLMSHMSEPFIEIHPGDAERFGVHDAELAEVSNANGQAILRVLVTDRQQSGSIFAPIHWTDQFASSARIDALVAGETDPISGQPELKAATAAIKRYDAAWYGFAVSRSKPSSHDARYWALAPAKYGWRMELAGDIEPADWLERARDCLGVRAEGTCDILSYRDTAAGTHRFAAFTPDGQLTGALFICRAPVAASRSWSASRLGETFGDARERFKFLAGRPGASEKDRGAIVCVCFEVGSNEIANVVMKGGCASVEAVGFALKAGTNCGSCRSEIGRIIDACRIKEAV